MDLLGLAIAEGDRECALDPRGNGSWSMGRTGGRGIGRRHPDYIECVTIAADDDDPGRRNAAELARRLGERNIGAQGRTLAFGGGEIMTTTQRLSPAASKHIFRARTPSEAGR